MKIKAERTEARYLKPGDLFSEHPPEFFANTNLASTMIFICLAPMPDDTDHYYRIIFEQERPAPTQTTQTTQAQWPIFDPSMPPGM